MSVPQTKNSRNIFAHRGFWNHKNEQNSLVSFQNAAREGFSIETDIRQFAGKLIISHDPPQSPLPLELLDVIGTQTTFALNIKEDGLQNSLNDIRFWVEETHSFVFDGSVPEMYRFHKLGIPHALRLSEFEKSLPWKSNVVWVDSFIEDWWINDSLIQQRLDDSRIIIVSPELHGRDPRFVWDFLAKHQFHGNSNFSICTDKPVEYLAWS